MHASVCIEPPQHSSSCLTASACASPLIKLHSATHEKRLPPTLGLVCDTAPMPIQYYAHVNCSAALPIRHNLGNTNVPPLSEPRTTTQTTADGCNAFMEWATCSHCALQWSVKICETWAGLSSMRWPDTTPPSRYFVDMGCMCGPT